MERHAGSRTKVRVIYLHPAPTPTRRLNSASERRRCGSLILAPTNDGRLACWGFMSAGAELTAVSSTLGELTNRVGRIIAELTPSEEERYGNDLLEVERTLGVANRRLERLVAGRR
jgi:hypothetical protein